MIQRLNASSAGAGWHLYLKMRVQDSSSLPLFLNRSVLCKTKHASQTTFTIRTTIGDMANSIADLGDRGHFMGGIVALAAVRSIVPAQYQMR